LKHLPSSVTSIGSYAFRFTRKLYILTIPSSIVNISGTTFARYDAVYGDDDFSLICPAPVVVFANNEGDMNLGGTPITNYYYGRWAFGYTSSQIKQDSGFVYVEKTLTAEILAIKDSPNTIIVPATYNSKTVTRINQRSFLLYNGGTRFVKITSGVQAISTDAFWNGYDTFLCGVSIPNSVTAVNYQAFHGLSGATIYCEPSSKPSDWDSSWYSGVANVQWGKYIDNVSTDGLFTFEYSGSSTYISKYLGTWNQLTPVIIPSSVEGRSVTGIRTGAITYSSSGSSSVPLTIYIPSSVVTIEVDAIRCNRETNVYASATSKPTGWNSNWIYNTYDAQYSTSSTYITFNWSSTIAVEGNYIYQVISNQAYLIKYIGSWAQCYSSTLTNRITVPSTIGGKTVIGIRSGCFYYTTYSSTSSSYYHALYISSIITTIETMAINAYFYSRIYSNASSQPAGWSSSMCYNTYYGSTGYNTFYWNETI
jgi:hypothetical protein